MSFNSILDHFVGIFVGELTLYDLPTAGVWDLSLYQSQHQLAIAISERVQVYTLEYGIV